MLFGLDVDRTVKYEEKIANPLPFDAGTCARMVRGRAMDV